MFFDTGLPPTPFALFFVELEQIRKARKSRVQSNYSGWKKGKKSFVLKITRRRMKSERDLFSLQFQQAFLCACFFVKWVPLAGRDVACLHNEFEFRSFVERRRRGNRPTSVTSAAIERTRLLKPRGTKKLARPATLMKFFLRLDKETIYTHAPRVRRTIGIFHLALFIFGNVNITTRYEAFPELRMRLAEDRLSN